MDLEYVVQGSRGRTVDGWTRLSSGDVKHLRSDEVSPDELPGSTARRSNAEREEGPKGLSNLTLIINQAQREGGKGGVD